MRQPQGPAVGPAGEPFHAGHRAIPEEAQQAARVERRPEGQPPEDLPLHGLAPASPGPPELPR
ncbi:MAG TPA: hypothetical protein VEZ19_03580, partial [Rubrobacter sp.]|nr:hypothetical protein [Rubrobacter sp.]